MKTLPLLLKFSFVLPNRMILAFIFGFILLPYVSIGQPTPLTFEKIGFDEGLPDNFCYSLIRDYLGFMWIGSGNGLVRYDGYDFITYLPDPEDPFSIKGRKITALIESTDNNLWIGTEWGLHYFNRDSERFTNILIDTNKVNPNPRYPWVVHYLFEDSKGRIWIISGEERNLHRVRDNLSM